MADGKRRMQSLGSTMIGFWQRIPVVIRTLVSGFLVTEIGIIAWRLSNDEQNYSL